MAAAKTYVIRQPQRRRRATLGIACAVLLAGALGVGMAVAEPSLRDQIDSAKSNAGQPSKRVEALSERIASLEQQARQAGARAMELNAQVQRAETRSRELARQLAAAQARLEELRAEYAQAVKQLDQRLIAIYESDAPDTITVLFNANGFDHLSTRSDYLKAIHDAALRVAHRVEPLRDRMAERTRQITELKREADQQARQLKAARASFVASERAANRDAAAVAAARSRVQSDLAAVQNRVAELEQQRAEQQAASAAAPAYLGGPYAIPSYIVTCESGRHYRPYNPSSGAGGAYQILPSTWRAYGGEGLPQNAPKAEQDRIAGEIWQDSGPTAWACG